MGRHLLPVRGHQIVPVVALELVLGVHICILKRLARGDVGVSQALQRRDVLLDNGDKRIALPNDLRMVPLMVEALVGIEDVEASYGR